MWGFWSLPRHQINMGVKIEALSCPNKIHSQVLCQNAIQHDEVTDFRCRIVDSAHQEGLSIFKIENTINPILLHVKGVGEMTRCMYHCGCLQALCFGSLIGPEGLKHLINYSKRGEIIIFPEKIKEITNVFSQKGYEIISRTALGQNGDTPISSYPYCKI